MASGDLFASKCWKRWLLSQGWQFLLPCQFYYSQWILITYVHLGKSSDMAERGNKRKKLIIPVDAGQGRACN